MFKCKQFLRDYFDNPRSLLAFLVSYNAPTPQPYAVEKWFQRGTIPSNWLPILLAYLELERGAPVSLVMYLEDRK